MDSFTKGLDDGQLGFKVRLRTIYLDSATLIVYQQLDSLNRYATDLAMNRFLFALEQ